MPAPLAVNKEAVRVLAVAVGVREAARQCNLKESTVMQWSAREGWFAEPERPALPPTMQKQIVSGVSNPADALRNSQLEDSEASKTYALQYARRTLLRAAQVAEDSPDEALTLANNVQAVTKVAATAGAWQVSQGGVNSVQVNLLIQP